MSGFLDIVQNLQVAIKALLMYTGSHPRSQAALGNLAQLLEEWLEQKPSLHIATSQGKLFLDGNPFEGKALHLTALARQLSERQISGIIFKRGVTAEELQEVLAILILKPAKLEEAGGASAVLAARQLAHVQLSQTQYKEVREGEGGDQDHGGPASTIRSADPVDPATIEALTGLAAALDAAAAGRDAQGAAAGQEAQGAGSAAAQAFELALIADQWEEQLDRLPQRSLLEGGFAPTDLNCLGGTPPSFGMGDGFPPAQQVEGLRQALLRLDPGRLLAVVAGIDSLPPDQQGMRMGFQSLAVEAFTRAGSALVQGEGPKGGWAAAGTALFETLRQAPQQRSMLAALEAELSAKGAGPEAMARLQELIQQLDWEGQSMEEKLRQAQEQGRLWQLSLDQRLRFLRRLLDEGRTEGLLELLDLILEALRLEDVARREMAAQSLTGVARWLLDPGLPVEAEGPLIEGLAAHFSWEPLAHIHRSSTEALGVVLASQVDRDEPGQALALLQKLAGLCAFQDDRQEWREAALTGLWASLGNPAHLKRVVELLHTANPETMLGELIPYLEAVGHPAAQLLVAVLGDEPDRKRRGRLLEAIRGLGEAALPAVYEGLSAPAWYLVRNTLNLLSDMGDAGALEPARACLDHPDGRVKRAAVRALWKLGGPAAVPPLLAAFPGVDPETQLEIMFALGQVRAAQAVAALAAFAQDRHNDERLRVRAAETIGQIGDPRAIPLLADLARRKGLIFTSAEPIAVRLAACRSLAGLETTLAMATLCEVVAAEPWHKDRTVLQQVVDQHRPA